MAKKSEKHVARVKAGLEEAYEKAQEAQTLDLATARVILFSDLHRGARNRADDFRKCERAFNAALAYYLRMGHTLVALGDMEELWEERVKPVLETYKHSLDLEAEFHRQGRYVRVWGNHDNTWNHAKTVQRWLVPRFGAQPLEVRESLRYRVVDGAEELGELFLVHGHQGTAGSDRYWRIARVGVRFFWRTWQRLTGKSLNTPATDYSLRGRHNLAMHEWAAEKDRFVLVAGHTHRPVLESRPLLAQLEKQLQEAEMLLDAHPDDASLIRKIAELSAQKEWVRAQDEHEPGAEEVPVFHRPAYFNTGCCCYLDGDITGIEIADQQIRLIRWPDDEGAARPQVLGAPISLRSVFERCRGIEAAAAEPAAEKEEPKKQPVLAGGGS